MRPSTGGWGTESARNEKMRRREEKKRERRREGMDEYALIHDPP